MNAKKMQEDMHNGIASISVEFIFEVDVVMFEQYMRGINFSRQLQKKNVP